MPGSRFLSQQQLVQWSDEGKLDVQGDRMVLVADKKACRIREAVHFLKLVSGEDQSGLVARVKTIQQLKDLGAEHYLDSVILGEAAYEVEQGYLADPDGAVAPSAVAARPAAADAKALAQFVLGKIG